jgi:hypothetical protein
VQHRRSEALHRASDKGRQSVKGQRVLAGRRRKEGGGSQRLSQVAGEFDEAAACAALR